MTINMNAIKKSLAMALAAVCISLPLTNVSEAAPPPQHGPQQHVNQQQHKQKSDVHFFKGQPPKHHKVCKNKYHARWAPHFHCSKANHHHNDQHKNHPTPPPKHNKR